MAKFAMIVSKAFDSTSIKAFQKKYSEKSLKKNIKCDSVISFDIYMKPLGYLGAKFKIEEGTLRELSRRLHCVDKDILIECGRVNYSTSKFFIFSDDALQSMFCFDCLSDDVHIITFELNQDSAEELVEKLEDISSAEYLVGQLTDAQDLYGSLSNIVQECQLSIFYRSAEEDIDEALTEAKEDFENLKSDIRGIINSSWTS